MSESRKSIHCAASDALRYLGNASYAILPRDIAHAFGELKKAFWTNVRILVDKEIEWIDARVAGGDDLREEWQRACGEEKSQETAEPVN
jgi:hypothetical protein